MKKILIMVIVILMLALSACQPTPEEQAVTHKDNLEELIQNTAAPMDSGDIQTPETEQTAGIDETQPEETEELAEKYQETLEFEDSAFKVIIDAVVDEPDGSISVAMVEPYKFTQEDVDRALEVFMPSVQIYKTYGEGDFIAKDTLQQQIIALDALIAKIKADETLDDKVRQSLIGIHAVPKGMLERMLENSTVDSQEWVETTSEITTVDINNTIGISVKADMGKLMPTFFGIKRNSIHSAMSFTNDDFDRGLISLKRINDDIPGMETTFEEAKELAEKTLKRLAITEGLRLVYTELGVPRGVPDEDWISTDYVPKRYMFYFASEINGILVPNIKICKGFEQEGADFDYKWEAEYICVAIDDTGIVEFLYFEPGEITEIINDNVEVISFEEALEIFRKQIFYEGVWTQQGVTFSDLTITKIQMNMFRLRLKDTNEYMYVPVWDFIGTWKTDFYETEPGKELSFLTINAIDGSIIDRNLGY